MRLRYLEIKDAPLMLEWMHDPAVIEYLNANFADKTLDDAVSFINRSISAENIHLAVVTDTDEYMGTVSLKHIDQGNHSAEFAISMRSASMGRGYAWYGIQAILEKGFNEYGLESIYWCVGRDNARAVRFYDKHNFHEAVDVLPTVVARYNDGRDYKWYSVIKGDVLDNRESVAGCKVIHIKTIPTIDAGELSFLEATHDIPFEIKRIYYVSKVPEGVRRGFHAHRSLQQVLFCPYGRIQLILENIDKREEIELSDPSIGVIIDKPTWREMLWLQKDSVLCVGASDFYNAEDYIRDYHAFKNFVKSKGVDSANTSSI